MYKRHKIRIYPTKEQIILINKHIDASRFMWNHMLEVQNKRQNDNDVFLRGYGMCKLITEMKKQDEYAWLKEVSIYSLQRVCMNLEQAYIRFFNHISRHPKFKSKKKSKRTFPVSNNHFYFRQEYVKIPVIGKMRYKTDLKNQLVNEKKFYNIYIYEEFNKYYIGFSTEYESQVFCKLNEESIGIDLGIKHLASVSFGDRLFKYGNINKSRKVKEIESKIKHLQKVISKKYSICKELNGEYIKSHNIEKCEIKLKKLYKRLHDIRCNYIHQTTASIVALMPSRIVMEDLNVAGMVKNRHLSKLILDQQFSVFINCMKYKSEKYGIQFVQANRFFPSSKTCSCCGNIKKILKLSERTYTCEECGLVIDRDYNAAINLMKYVDQK